MTPVFGGEWRVSVPLDELNALLNFKQDTKTEFIQRGYNTADYHFIEEAGTFQARLDLKVWGKRRLECFFTLSDERKILACTFQEMNYLGIAEIAIGSEMTLTFEKAVRGKRIYLRKATMGKICP